MQKGGIVGMDYINKKLLKLKEELSLKKIFNIICENKKKFAAIYTKNSIIKKITYEEYEEITINTSCKLSRLIGEEKRGVFIGIKMDNCYEWPILFWAILMSGYKPILLDFRFDDDMTLYLMNQAGAIALISNEEKSKYKEFVQIKPEELINDENIDLGSWNEKWANEIALCTSGTTSTAKIYVYNGYALSRLILNIEDEVLARLFLIGNKEIRALAFLPFFHIFGFTNVYLLYSFFGKPIVYLENRGPHTILETCRKNQITHISAVPLLWNSIAKGILNEVNKSKHKSLFFKFHRLSLFIQKLSPTIGRSCAKLLFKKIHKKLLGNDILLLICGGGYVLNETLEILNGIGLNIICGFGMTEVGITSVNLEESIDRKLTNSLGRAFKSVQYKIEPLKNKNFENVGELYIKGKSIHSGRLENGVLLPPSIDSDGWFATGDIACLNDGSLTLHGRIKDIIINESGENVYPDELEAYFCNLKNADNICIVGVNGKGQYQCLTLILDVGDNYANKEIINELSEEIYIINGNLPVYKKVQKVLISTEPLNKFIDLKVKRQKLKQYVEENQSKFMELDLKQSFKEIKEKIKLEEQQIIKESEVNLIDIKNIIRQYFSEALEIPVEEIEDDADFINDLGADSLQCAEIIVKVEDRFKLSISNSEYFNCTNIDNLSSLISKKIHKSTVSN